MSTSESAVTATLAPEPRRGSPVLLALALVVAVAFLACAGLVGYSLVTTLATGGKEATAEVESLLAAMATGEAAEFYRQRTTAEFRAQTSAADFERLADAVRTRLGPATSLHQKHIMVRQMNVDGSIELKHDVTFAQGQGQVASVWRRRAAERWRLHTLVINSPQLLATAAEATCPHCQAPVSADAKFCPQCGQALTDGDAPTSPVGLPPASDTDTQPAEPAAAQ